MKSLKNNLAILTTFFELYVELEIFPYYISSGRKFQVRGLDFPPDSRKVYFYLPFYIGDKDSFKERDYINSYILSEIESMHRYISAECMEKGILKPIGIDFTILTIEPKSSEYENEEDDNIGKGLKQWIQMDK
jgi:hypothetical protein